MMLGCLVCLMGGVFKGISVWLLHVISGKNLSYIDNYCISNIINT